MDTESVFVDPSVVSPRELTGPEMDDLAGGMPAFVVAAACGSALGGAFGVGIIHVAA